MDEKEIIEKILFDAKIWVAIFGFLGVIAGSTINFFIEWWKRRPKQKLDKKRQEMLKTMLKDEKFNDKWRNLSTLSAVIGASENEAKRLLIKINARGSEKQDELWGLMEFHPLDKTER